MPRPSSLAVVLCSECRERVAVCLAWQVPFSLAAAFELLGQADMLVGNMGSHVTRVLYNKMVGASRTGVLPPFLSVDGYGLCCDFTEDCTKEDISKRKRPIRDCIHKYGQCTGGDQFFFHKG